MTPEQFNALVVLIQAMIAEAKCPDDLHAFACRREAECLAEELLVKGGRGMTRCDAINEAIDDALSGDAYCEDVERQFLSSLAASGYAIVPIEATDAMVLAALDRHQRDDEVMHASIWRAMLAAAQKGQG